MFAIVLLTDAGRFGHCRLRCLTVILVRRYIAGKLGLLGTCLLQGRLDLGDLRLGIIDRRLESTGPLLIAGDAIAFGGTNVVGRCARVP